MVKARSPGYPAISLGEAVEKITLIYKKDYQNKIPRSVLAQHAGYQSLNGKSLSVLASLLKFGLLEGRGEENWVSDLALQIIAHARGTSERLTAVAEAASAPELFAEVDGRFPSGASDAALRSYLLTRKFLPQAADIVVRCYRDTKQFLADEGVNHLSHDHATDETVVARTMSSQVIDKSQLFESSGVPQISTRGAVDILQPEERELTAGILSKGARFRLVVSGKIGEREIDMLIRKLQLDREILAASEVGNDEGGEQITERLL